MNVFCTYTIIMEEASLLFTSSILFWYLYNNKKCFYPEQRIPEEQRIVKKSNNPEADYHKELELFNQLFKKEERNLNIQPDLYRDKSFKNNHEQDWCIVENAWKSRILFQNTAQGNVIMYYDIYKLAFVYYSDMQVSYKWLNFCAMKYVRIFYCLDFFVDDSFLPANFVNPFNRNKTDEENKDLAKKEKKRESMKVDFKSDVFLKKKKEPKKPHTKKGGEVKQEEKFVNNFRYMGKLNNYSFLKVPLKQEKICENYQYIDFKLKLEKSKLEQSKLEQSIQTKEKEKEKQGSQLYGWL